VWSAMCRGARLATGRSRLALWTLLALASAMFVAALAVVTAATIDRWAAAHPGSGGAMVVYLSDGVDDARARVLVAELAALRGVERAELVPPGESARRLTRALGADATLLDGVEVASLPGSVEVQLSPGVRDVIAMSPTVRALRGAAGVADVVIEDAADDRVAAALHTARSVAWVGAALFAGLAVVIAVAAIRIRLDRSPEQAEVLHLLGAPPAFAAVPSALAGGLHGAAAAVLAGAALAALAWGRTTALGSVEVAAPPLAALAGLIAVGSLVGLIGGGLAGVARAR
jgi:cell division protein FtsX